MNRRLVVRPLAWRELAETVDWYEAQRIGLGGKFIDSFQAAVDSIVQNPFHYQIVGRQTRRVALHRFPHGLMYSVSDEVIVVLSCFHSSRNPRWRK